MLTFEDLLGEGAYLDGETLVIPKENLREVNLSSFDNPEKILGAIFLRAIGYFEGVLVNEDGDYLIDADGLEIAYKKISENLEISSYAQLIENNTLIYEYAFNFYEEK